MLGAADQWSGLRCMNVPLMVCWVLYQVCVCGGGDTKTLSSPSAHLTAMWGTVGWRTVVVELEETVMVLGMSVWAPEGEGSSGMIAGMSHVDSWDLAGI